VSFGVDRSINAISSSQRSGICSCECKRSFLPQKVSSLTCGEGTGRFSVDIQLQIYVKSIVILVAFVSGARKPKIDSSEHGTSGIVCGLCGAEGAQLKLKGGSRNEHVHVCE